MEFRFPEIPDARLYAGIVESTFTVSANSTPETTSARAASAGFFEIDFM